MVVVTLAYGTDHHPGYDSDGFCLACDRQTPPPGTRQPRARGYCGCLSAADTTVTADRGQNVTPLPTPALADDNGPLAGLRDGGWLDAQHFPDLTYAVPGIVPEGMSLLVGPPKAGKSWAALGMALAVSSGRPAFGSLPVGDPRPVLLLALEDGDRRLQSRCRTVADHQPIPSRLQFLTRLKASAPATITAWLDRYGDARPLVILDTLGKSMPPARNGEGQYAHEYRYASELKRTVDDHPGTALVVVHHDRKAAADDFVDSVSGTHGLAGAADSVIVLARPRGEDSGLLKVTGRDVTEAEYSVTLDGGTWRLDGDSLDAAMRNARATRATAGLGDTNREIYDALASRPERDTPSAIAAALGMDNKRVGDYLARMVESGRVVKRSRSRYAIADSL